MMLDGRFPGDNIASWGNTDLCVCADLRRGTGQVVAYIGNQPVGSLARVSVIAIRRDLRLR